MEHTVTRRGLNGRDAETERRRRAEHRRRERGMSLAPPVRANITRRVRRTRETAPVASNEGYCLLIDPLGSKRRSLPLSYAPPSTEQVYVYAKAGHL